MDSHRSDVTGGQAADGGQLAGLAERARRLARKAGRCALGAGPATHHTSQAAEKDKRTLGSEQSTESTSTTGAASTVRATGECKASPILQAGTQDAIRATGSNREQGSVNKQKEQRTGRCWRRCCWKPIRARRRCSGPGCCCTFRPGTACDNTEFQTRSNSFGSREGDQGHTHTHQQECERN
jgi:hypothetical protein